ncbi:MULTISPECIES: hypothetical protein [Trichocoleus]|uniref:Uncharacterized protein n=1 Tax=Trichocoleus desertorum GB2-A4 TaxID=2933944 RepID=A0ABV0JEK1_9CYAN|nr:hypothetical protein [Trichocoleus sp. FACHB-46]MBD1864162.1 hypothetical protein [Trichocoleus sp. FACHB-46]
MSAARLSPQKRYQRNQSIIEAYKHKDKTKESVLEIAQRHFVSVPLLYKIVDKASEELPINATCIEPGCQELAKARGWCGKHYQQWWKANLAPTKKKSFAKARRASQKKYYDKGLAQEVYASYADTPKGKAARSRSQYWFKVLHFLNRAELKAIAQSFSNIPQESIQKLVDNRLLTWEKIRTLLPESEVEILRDLGLDTQQAKTINRQRKYEV